MTRVGLISDTHNLVRPEALDFLQGVSLILHAGDICKPEVLDALRAIAPVTAVRGNNDQGEWSRKLAVSEMVRIEDAFIYMVHDVADLDIDPVAGGVHAVISGHSHKPFVETRDGVLHVNPGSAGPRRFTLPVSVGELFIDGAHVTASTKVIA